MSTHFYKDHYCYYKSTLFPFFGTTMTTTYYPNNPDEDIWHYPSRLKWGYHPDAEWCMRSRPTEGGHGQQCCYDRKGALITHGESAGTPDYVSPSESYWGHRSEDVKPFDYCKAAEMLDVYFKHRTPNTGPKGKPYKKNP